MRAQRFRLAISLLSLGLTACAAQDGGADTPIEETDTASEQGNAPPADDSTQRAGKPQGATESSGAPEGESEAEFDAAASILFGAECPSNPCRNGGTCRETIFSYACTCPAGFTGAQCQTATGGGGSGCATPAAPTNGTVSTHGNRSGGVATYACNTGFRLSGAKSRTCQSNGTWSGVAPLCEAATCGTLLAPTNGTVWTTGTSAGSTATYACNGGFTLSGNKSRTCQAIGTWSGSAPSCVSTCGNGRVDFGEACDWSATSSNPWTCTTRCTSTRLYNGCFDDSQCSQGESCYVGVCTQGCGSGSSCPALTSRATSGTAKCMGGGFGCFVECSSTSQCAPGLICGDGICKGCWDGGPACPIGQQCVGAGDTGSGLCR